MNMNKEEERTFSDALYRLKEKRKMFRSDWNGIKLGKDMYVYLENLKKDDIEFKPCFIFFDGFAYHAGWMPSIWDILGVDWKIRE